MAEALPNISQLFFGLNLLFNAVMWGLFTRALTLASSTVRVSVINTSANFMITAILGLVIFSETLPALWWLGAALLVAGSVIIGRREEESKAVATTSAEPQLEKDSSDSGEFKDDSDDGQTTGNKVKLKSVKGTGGKDTRRRGRR